MSEALFDLAGQVALITGSSRGLGLAMARGLAQAGARVALNGRDEQTLAAAVAKLRDEGFDAGGFAFDVCDTGRITAGVARIQDEFGAVEILVNNVGMHRRAPLEELSEEAWRDVVDVNLTSAFLVARQVVAAMIRRKSGKIINICSLMSEVGRTTTAPYAAAKGGLKMLTRAMTVEWARHNIQINGIGPGYFLTELTQKLAADPEFDAWVKQRTPAGRWGLPSDLVGAAVFFASPASNFVSGQVLYVDGGILASL